MEWSATIGGRQPDTETYEVNEKKKISDVKNQNEQATIEKRIHAHTMRIYCIDTEIRHLWLNRATATCSH